MDKSGRKDRWRFITSQCVADNCYWALVLILLGLIFAYPYQINEDCALRIDLAQRVLEGKLPYVDFIDVTPPATTYLSVIPVLLAKLLSADVIFVFSMTVLALVAWSSWMVRKIVRRSGTVYDETQLGMMLFVWTLFSLLMFKRGYFGEREHIFVLLFLPFLVVRWLRAQDAEISSLTALIVGFAAGIGTCIKPYFVLVALVPELYWLLHSRKPGLFRPEIGAYVCAGALFALHLFLLPDSVTRNLFGRWLPLILDRYGVYNCDVMHLLVRRDFLFAAAAIIGPFLVKLNGTESLGGFARPVAMSVLGAAMAFLVQHKGFSYQLFPAVGLAAVGITIIAYELIAVYMAHYWNFDRHKTIAAKLICTVMFSVASIFLVLVAVRAITKVPESHSSTPLAQAIEELSRRDDAVLVISPAVGASYPMLLQLGRKPATRFANIFWIGMLYPNTKTAPDGEFPYRSQGQATPEEALLLGELAEDIHTFRPTLVVIPNQSYCHGCPTGFNILRYLEKIGFMANMLKEYRLVRTLPDFNVYIRLDHG